MNKPKYDHWCKDAIFLGRFTNAFSIEYDLYWCAEHGPEARWGDFPFDLAHGMEHAYKHEGLMEAIKIRRNDEARRNHLQDEKDRSNNTAKQTT